MNAIVLFPANPTNYYTEFVQVLLLLLQTNFYIECSHLVCEPTLELTVHLMSTKYTNNYLTYSTNFITYIIMAHVKI